MPISDRRLKALNDQFRDEISDIILHELRDPRLGLIVSILSVEITNDLRHAKVFVSTLGSEADRTHAVEILNHAARFIRHGLTKRLKIKQIPELHFHSDNSLERGERILHLLREVNNESQTATHSKNLNSAGSSEAPVETSDAKTDE